MKSRRHHLWEQAYRRQRRKSRLLSTADDPANVPPHWCGTCRYFEDRPGEYGFCRAEPLPTILARDAPRIRFHPRECIETDFCQTMWRAPE
jgi:hypothetical protein